MSSGRRQIARHRREATTRVPGGKLTDGEKLGPHGQRLTLHNRAAFKELNYDTRGAAGAEARWRKETGQGGLPDGWEVAYDDDGHAFFINHKEETTTYDDPRKRKPRTLQNQPECKVRAPLDPSPGTHLCPECSGGRQRCDRETHGPRRGFIHASGVPRSLWWHR